MDNNNDSIGSYALWLVAAFIMWATFLYVYLMYVWPAMVRAYWACAKALYWALRGFMVSTRHDERNPYTASVRRKVQS